MIKISGIRKEANYLILHFTGNYEIPQRIELAPGILEASKQHDCHNLLFDYLAVEDLSRISLTAEHMAAKDIAKIYGANYRIAIALPERDNPIGKHHENVAVNRGAQVYITATLEDAKTWLSKFK